MATRTLRIGTRASALALWQANWVKDELEKRYPDLEVTLTKIKTQGDKILVVPLAMVGGKGLFVKEIQEAMLRNEVDIAVHSMKDVPAELPEGLHVAIVPKREIAQDAFISVKYKTVDDLPKGAVIGTSSLRRKSQLTCLRPDLNIKDLRGNLDTRLGKLDKGEYDAIILAGAGLNRLGMQDRITTLFTPDQMLPAIRQCFAVFRYTLQAEHTLHLALAQFFSLDRLTIDVEDAAAHLNAVARQTDQSLEVVYLCVRRQLENDHIAPFRF